MQVLSFEYKKKKWKLIAYIVGGTILLIILLIAALTGQLQETVVITQPLQKHN